MITSRMLWHLAATLVMLFVLGDPKAHAQQRFRTIAIGKCGHLVVGSGNNAEAAERNARYRCRIGGGWECSHPMASATVPGPRGDHCAAIATHRLGICHFLAKAGYGNTAEDAETMAVQLCGGSSAANQCQVRSSHIICQ
jgi:hypothetical protein